MHVIAGAVLGRGEIIDHYIGDQFVMAGVMMKLTKQQLTIQHCSVQRFISKSL